MTEEVKHQIRESEIEAFFKKTPRKSLESILAEESVIPDECDRDFDEIVHRRDPFVEAQITEWRSENNEFIWHLELVHALPYKHVMPAYFWLCLNPSNTLDANQEEINWNPPTPFGCPVTAMLTLKSWFALGLHCGGTRRKFSKLSVQFSKALETTE